MTEGLYLPQQSMSPKYVSRLKKVCLDFTGIDSFGMKYTVFR